MPKIPPKRCDEIDKLVYAIHMDYGISSFPVDEKWLASEMGFILVRYADLTKENKKTMEDLLQTGVHLCSKEKGYPSFKIAFNDETEPGRVKLTVFHEVGHIILGHGSHPTPVQEAEADYFAKQMAAPRCLLRYRKHTSVSDIHQIYGLSKEASEYTAKAIERTNEIFGDQILENDQEYIDWVRGWSPF